MRSWSKRSTRRLTASGAGVDMLHMSEGRQARARAGAEEGRQLAAHGLRLLPAAPRSAPAYYVREREAHGFGIRSLVLVVEQHLGLDGGAVARSTALGRELVELPTEVGASPPSDEQVRDVLNPETPHAFRVSRTLVSLAIMPAMAASYRAAMSARFASRVCLTRSRSCFASQFAFRLTESLTVLPPFPRLFLGASLSR